MRYSKAANCDVRVQPYDIPNLIFTDTRARLISRRVLYRTRLDFPRQKPHVRFTARRRRAIYPAGNVAPLNEL